jgi:hypothetical protein
MTEEEKRPGDGKSASPSADGSLPRVTSKQMSNELSMVIGETQSQIIHPTSKIENMEVHHHPDLGHKRKNFREYFLEFLMIFLAVSLGFFAESLRERISEHARAKEYAATMLSDLSSDTTDLKSYINYFNYAAGNVDTLMQLLSAADPRQIPAGKLYWYGLFGGARRPFAPHDATLLEMKNSGSLRYFSNALINRKVAEYDQICQVIKGIEASEEGIYTEVRKIRGQIFEFKYNDAANTIFQSGKTSFSQAKIDSFANTNPPLLSYDKTIFNQYIEMVRSRYLRLKIGHADDMLRNATELIGLLKKEYNLENE